MKTLHRAFSMIRALVEMMETGCNELKRIESVCSFICAEGGKVQRDCRSFKKVQLIFVEQMIQSGQECCDQELRNGQVDCDAM